MCHLIEGRGEMMLFDLARQVYCHKMEVAAVPCHVLAHCHVMVVDGHSVATELDPGAA